MISLKIGLQVYRGKHEKTSILIISVFIMAILTACGSSADNSQKQETIVKQPEATSMTVELDENVSETNDTAEDTKIVNNETDSVKIAVVYFLAQEIQRLLQR